MVPLSTDFFPPHTAISVSVLTHTSTSMPQRNIHSCRPTTVGGWLCLMLSYVPCILAVGIMLVIMVPFYNLFCYQVLWRHYDDNAFFFCVTTLTVTTSFALLLVSYWRCIVTSPGFVNAAVWSSPPVCRGRFVEGSKNQNSVAHLGQDGQPRFCRVCMIYKPDDAHHCHDCGQCVERMDHHCPWINNCVGRDTEKYFILFIMYVSLTGCLVGCFIGYAFQEGITSAGFFHAFLLVVDGISAAVFGVVMFFFGAFHVFMLLRGITTIDFVIAWRTSNPAAAQATLQRRQRVLDHVFGVDRRWWSYVLPTAPKRRPMDDPEAWQLIV